MALKPSTRNVLISAGGVIVVFALAMARSLFMLSGRLGGDRQSDGPVFLFYTCFFGGVTALGLLLAWLSLQRHRRNARNKAKPLDFN